MSRGHIRMRRRLPRRSRAIRAALRAKAAAFIEWHLQAKRTSARSPTSGGATAALRGADANRVRNLTDLMPLCVWAANREGRVTYMNKAWAEYAGIDAPAANEGGLLDVIHPDDRERVVAAWSEGVRAGEPLVVEYRLRRQPTARIAGISGALSPSMRRAAPSIGWISTATDIRGPEGSAGADGELPRTPTLRAPTPNRRTDEGRVPRDHLARAAHAAQRHLRLDANAARRRARRRAGGRRRSRRSSATRAPRSSSSRICSTSLASPRASSSSI